MTMAFWEIWSYVHVPLVWYLFKRYAHKDVSGSIIAGAIIGCFLEFSTEPLWTYHFRFTIYKDIAPSIFLGWGVLFTLTMYVSERLYQAVLHRRRVDAGDKRLFAFDVLAACLIAFPMETLGMKSGVWNYNQSVLHWSWGTVPLLHMPYEALLAYVLLMLIAPTFIRRWRGAFSMRHWRLS
jgi:hypothetical protein